jgi:hypothetical protein
MRGGGVIDTLPMGIEPNPVLRQDGSWRLLNAVLAGCANSIGAVRYADSECWIWWATHAMTVWRPALVPWGSQGVAGRA